MDNFYSDTIRQLCEDGLLNCGMRVLVVCGGVLDRDVFAEAGFTDVVISNVDVREKDAAPTPFEWECQQAEALTYADGHFDWVVVHYGLHHCRQPHKALCEMYRVAKRGILLFEPHENLLVRLGRRLNVGQTYEVHAVAEHDLRTGGVNNGPVPNFVYRWTAREVFDTLRAYAPEYRIRGRATYHAEIHWHDLKAKRNKLPLVLAAVGWPVLRLARVCYPPLANTFAVVVEKDGPLQDWLVRTGDGEVLPDKKWFTENIKGNLRVALG